MSVKNISPILGFLDLSEQRGYEKLCSAESRGGNSGCEISRLRIRICSFHSDEELSWNVISISLFLNKLKLGLGKSYKKQNKTEQKITW